MLPLRARMGMRAMAFLKALALLEPYHQIVNVISKTLIGGSYSSAEMQSVFSTPADSTGKKGKNRSFRHIGHLILAHKSN